MKKNITCVLMAGFLFSPSILFAATNDAVHYWKFDDGQGISALDSVAGKNGTVVGSSTGLGWAGGKAGVSLAMDGAAGTGVMIPGLVLSGSEGTISLWMKMNTLSEQNILLSGRSISENSVYVALVVDREGRPMIQYRGAAGDQDKRTQATKILNKDEWYHLVFSAMGNGYRFSINGEEVGVAGDGNGRWFSDITNHTLEYRIGSMVSSVLSGSFNGYIDDVRVFSRVLSSEEIRSLYNETNEMVPAVPLAALPQVTLSASAGNVAPNSVVVLTWGGKNVDSCTKSGDWQGAASVSGNEPTGKLTATSTYTITCVGKNGSASNSVTVGVHSSLAPVSDGVVQQEIVLTKPMSESERQALIAELKKKIMELIVKLQQLLIAQQQKTY